jgi:quercetin dioxygenase-like cupin family protein
MGARCKIAPRRANAISGTDCAGFVPEPGKQTFIEKNTKGELAMMTRREMNGTVAGALTALFAAGTGALLDSKTAEAQQVGHGQMHGMSPVKTLMQEPLGDIPNPEVSVITLTVGPGTVSPPHEHIGPVFAYILEGEIENQVEPDAPKRYGPGDYFYEPAMHVHKMLKNLSKTKPAKLLIFQVGEKGKQFTIGVKS